MYKRILLPLDGSETAASSIPHALELTTTYDAALYTISVIEEHDGDDDEEGVEGIFEAFEEQSKTMVDDVVQQAKDRGIRTTAGSIVAGRPHRAILEYVIDHDIDLIVMGTPQERGLLEPLHRSVTEKVIRRATVPVVTVGPHVK